MDASEAYRDLGTLAAFMAAMRGPKLKADFDARPAVAAATALRTGLDAGSQAISRFNRIALTMGNVGRVAARVGVLSLVGALAPLVGMATVAAGALGALVLAFGLLAGPAAMSISALTNAEAASEGYEQALASQQDALDGVTEAEEEHARTVEDATASVEAALEARKQAAESLRRTEITSAEAIADGRKRVTDQARALEEAEKSRARGIREATGEYRATLSELGQIEQDNAERLREAYATRTEALKSYRETRRSVAESIAEEQRTLVELERAYTETVRDNARQIIEARRGIAEAEQAYVETVRENRERLAELEESYLEAVEERREAFAEAAERERDARVRAEEGIARAIEEAGEAARTTAERERDLLESRRDALRATQDLRDAQNDLNRAMRDEPLRQADAALSVREKEFQLAQTIAEYQEAAALGDTDRAGELQLRAERLRLDLAGAKNDLSDIRAGGSDELNSARDAVESAWRAEQESRRRVVESEQALDNARRSEVEARRGISLARSEGAELIAEAAKEAADLREAAVDRVIDSRKALAEGAREAARSEIEAARGITAARRNLSQVQREAATSERTAAREIVEQRKAVAEAVRSGARELRESWGDVQEANRDVSRTIRENAEALIEGQERAAAAFARIAEARRQGNAEVAAQERALAEAIEQQQRTIRQARWDIADQREALAKANEDYRQSHIDADRDIRASQDRVIEAEEDLAEAVEETGKAAKERGQNLTRSQEALLAAALAFAAAYSAAFAPAQDVLNYLAIDIMALATKALPYLGEIARQTAVALTAVFAEMSRIWQGEGQIALFKRFFDAIPGITANIISGFFKLGTAIMNVFAAATPYIEDFAAYLDRIFGDFLEWTQTVSGQRALQNFFEEVSWWAGILADVVGDVARLLYRIGTSEGAKQLFANLAYFIELLASNPEGITAALWVLGQIGRAINFLLGVIPGLAPAAVIVGSFIGTLALFGGGGMLASIAGAWAMRRAINALFRAFGSSIRIPSITQMFIRLGRRGIAPLGRLASSAARAVVRFFGWMGRQLGRIFGSIPRLLRRGFSGFGRFSGQAVQALLRPFRGLPGRIGGFLSRIPQIARRIFGRVPPIGIGRIGALGQGIFRLLRFSGRWFAPLAGVVGNLFGGNGRFAWLLRGFLRVAGRILGPVGWVMLAWDAVRGVADTWTWLRRDAWQNTMKPWLDLLPQAFANPFGRTPPEVHRQLIESLKRFPLVAPFVTAADAIVDFLGRTFSGLGEWLGGAWRGILKGIQDGVSRFWDWLKEIGESAWKYLSSFWEIASPSRRMYRLWRNVMAGGTNAVKDAIPEMLAAARAVSEAAAVNIAPINVPTATVSMPARAGVPSASTMRARIEGEVERRLARTPGIGQPISITLPIEIGGRRVDEYIVEVVDGEAKTRKRTPNVPQGNFR